MANLSRSRDARAVALTPLPQASADLRAEMDVIAASVSFAPDERAHALAKLQRTVGRTPMASVARVCLTAALGDLHRMAGQAGPATNYLMQAYRMSRGRPDVRLQVQLKLAKLMRYAGELELAIGLQREAVAAFRSRGDSLSTATTSGILGVYLNDAGRFEEALSALHESARGSAGLVDPIGDSYRAFERCRAWFGLDRLDEAARPCRQAYRRFLTQQDASAANAQVMLARIALASHRTDEAAEAIGKAFATGAIESASVNARDAFRTRADVRAAQGNWRGALDDLKLANALYVRWNDAQRDRRNAVLRARYRLDSQLERNASLTRELAVVAERNAARRRVGMTAGAAGSLIIAMLVGGLIWSRRRRRELVAAWATAEVAVVERSRVLEDMSHDIRAPLGTLALQASNLKRMAGLSISAQRATQEIEAVTERVVRLLDRILSGEAAKAAAPAVSAPVVVKDLITRLSAETAAAAQSHVQIKHHFSDTLPATLTVNEVRLSRIVTNLLTNAVRHGGGAIDVSVTRDFARSGHWLRIDVADRGPGLEQANGRVAPPRRDLRSPDAGGHGIGLSISSKLAKEMGGELSYRTRKNGGARFIVTLPTN